MAGLSTFKCTVNQGINIQGAEAAAGVAGPGSQNNISFSQSFTNNGLSNTAVLGADDGYTLLLTIAPSGNQVIDLTNFPDVGGQPAASLARLKGYRAHLLNATQTAPDGTAGNACSSITVGNAASNGNLLNTAVVLNGATGGTPLPVFNVSNGSCQTYTDGSANGITVDGTHKNVKILNNDSVNAAKVLFSFWGGFN